MANTSISDQLVHVTVRIECADSSKQISSGTGFMVNFCQSSDGKHVPALVTNKHVIVGAQEGRVHFNAANESGEPDYGNFAAIHITDFEKGWILHPDPAVDLAAYPVAGLLTQLHENGHRPFFKAIDRDFMTSDQDLAELSAVEDILMVGYPNGLWDPKNNLPIVRRGITATPAYMDFEGRKEFMIDCACFPGSSGSPIFLYNIGSYANKSGGTTIGSRVKFLGVLWGGPQHTASGEIKVVPVPTTTQPIAVSRIPNNLGYCIKAEQILAFDELFLYKLKMGS